MDEEAAIEQERLMPQTLVDDTPLQPPNSPMPDSDVVVSSPVLSLQLDLPNWFLAAIGFLYWGCCGVAMDEEAAPDLERLMLQSQADERPPQLPNSPMTYHDVVISSEDLSLQLRHLNWFLAAMGFLNSGDSTAQIVRSAVVFVLLGLAAPVFAIYIAHCPDGEEGKECRWFHVLWLDVSFFCFDFLLAASSLVCISMKRIEYGTQSILFVDPQQANDVRFKTEYAHKIQGFFGSIRWLVLPCFLAKFICEAVRFAHVRGSAWMAIVGFLASIISWTYLTTLLVSACQLFNLVCNIQLILFEDYANPLKKETVASVSLDEHLRMGNYVRKISHRFRLYLILLFLLVAASEFVAVFETTVYSKAVNIASAGGIVVSSIVQVCGVFLCLRAAAKISHRGQSLGAIASRWHAKATFDDRQSLGAIATMARASGSDLGLFDDNSMQTGNRFPHHLLSYPKRDAFVTYLQLNQCGITLFGWMLDRLFVYTIFVFELNLIMFVLGKTIILSTN